MENPVNEEEISARSKMPAERMTPGHSDEKDVSARSKMPAESMTPGHADPARFEMSAQNSVHSFVELGWGVDEGSM